MARAAPEQTLKVADSRALRVLMVLCLLLTCIVRAAVEGTVKSVMAISGNPVLVGVAIEAVKQWKFAPCNSTDMSEIQFDFRPTEK